MQLVEFWWYELSPYLYAWGGIYFTLNIHNGGMYFAYLLLLLSIWILVMRIHHRSGFMPTGVQINWARERDGARRRTRQHAHRQKY